MSSPFTFEQKSIHTMPSFSKKIFLYVTGWFRSDYSAPHEGKKGIDWVGSIPFLLVHAMCLGIIWTGWSTFALLFAVIMYLLRMFAITAFYHRYFSHHAFETNKFFQFIFAMWGCSALQRGPLWWAAIHRHHHIYADTDKDLHSPVRQGFFWSHIGWILAYENKRTRIEYLKDWLKFPELVFMDKFAYVIPVIEAPVIFIIGHLLSIYNPGLNTNGIQLLIWGFFISTVMSSHATFTINSLIICTVQGDIIFRIRAAIMY